MPLLHLGARIDGVSGEIWEAQPSQDRKKRTIALDLSQENTELVPRSSFEYSGLTASLAKTPEYDSLLIRVKATAVTPEVYIPCATLFLFFWGVSSSLLDAVITEKLLSPERHIYNPDNTDLNSDPIRLEVRSRWTDVEAPYLATLLKEPDALEAGQRVFKRIAATRLLDQAGLLPPNQKGLLPLEVWPPFARTVSLTGLFRDMGNALLLTHIISSDIDASWTALDLYREGGRRVRTLTEHEKPQEAPTKPPPSGSPSIGPTDEVELSETPGGYGAGAADLPAVAALNARFPALANVKVHKPINKDPVEQKKRKRHKRLPGPWTAIDGSPFGQGKAIKGKIVGHEVHEPLGEASVEVIRTDAPLDEQLLKFADRLSRPIGQVEIDGHETSVQLDFWDPYRALSGARRPMFFDFPKEIYGERLTWLYRDPDCRRTKQGLCVRATATDGDGNLRTRFIVDLERRIPRRRDGTANADPVNSGLMVVWFDGASSPIDTCVSLVIVLSDAARRGSPAVRKRPFPGVHIATIRHSDSISQICSNALTVEDQCISSTRHKST